MGRDKVGVDVQRGKGGSAAGQGQRAFCAVRISLAMSSSLRPSTDGARATSPAPASTEAAGRFIAICVSPEVGVQGPFLTRLQGNRGSC